MFGIADARATVTVRRARAGKVREDTPQLKIDDAGEAPGLNGLAVKVIHRGRAVNESGNSAPVVIHSSNSKKHSCTSTFYLLAPLSRLSSSVGVAGGRARQVPEDV